MIALDMHAAAVQPCNISLKATPASLGKPKVRACLFSVKNPIAAAKKKLYVQFVPGATQ